MIARVATFAMNEKMLAASLETQARMSNMQLQQASGRVSESYGGLGTDAEQLAKLEVSKTRSEAYSAGTSEAVSRIEVMYDALSSITDILTQLRSDVAVALSVNGGDTANTDLIQAAQNYLDQLSSLLNTQYEGRYLFSGSATTTKPVDAEAVAAADLSTPLTDYYQGDSTIATVRVSESQDISYGVTADNSAFEGALRVLGYLADASAADLDADTLSEVSALLLDSLDATTAVQSSLSLNASALERSAASQQTYQDSLTASISAVRDVDITSVAATLTVYETQLEASYSALGRLQSISLVKYL